MRFPPHLVVRRETIVDISLFFIESADASTPSRRQNAEKPTPQHSRGRSEGCYNAGRSRLRGREKKG